MSFCETHKLNSITFFNSKKIGMKTNSRRLDFTNLKLNRNTGPAYFLLLLSLNKHDKSQFVMNV